jgi:peptidoglycan/xylan/chitin deacetylase (PgdA/CDA1 family)
MQKLTSESATLVDDPVPGPVRDYVGYGAEPPVVEFPGGARVALQLVINYEEGSERSLPAGDGRNESVGETARALAADYRDLHVESVFEYGSRAGIWRLLRLFDRYQVPCTFFAAAIALERNPAFARAAIDSGHEIAAHGWRWSEQWLLARDEERLHIESAIASIEASTGVRPRGWYSRYGPTVHTRELLAEIGGFRYDADAYNDDLPYFVRAAGRPHLVVPYTPVHNDMRFAIQGFSSPRDFYETCADALDYLADEGETHPRMLSIGLHPRLIGQPGRAGALKALLEHAVERGDVWFARRIDIADLWWNRFERAA